MYNLTKRSHSKFFFKNLERVELCLSCMFLYVENTFKNFYQIILYIIMVLSTEKTLEFQNSTLNFLLCALLKLQKII